MMRTTWDGRSVSAPVDTDKCAQTIGRPHPGDWVHWLFAPDNPGADGVVQLMTQCGKRAHRFVLESDGKEVDCPACLENAVP